MRSRYRDIFFALRPMLRAAQMLSLLPILPKSATLRDVPVRCCLRRCAPGRARRDAGVDRPRTANIPDHRPPNRLIEPPIHLRIRGGWVWFVFSDCVWVGWEWGVSLVGAQSSALVCVTLALGWAQDFASCGPRHRTLSMRVGIALSMDALPGRRRS